MKPSIHVILAFAIIGMTSCRAAGPGGAAPEPVTPAVPGAPGAEPTVRIGVVVDSSQVTIASTGEYDIMPEGGSTTRAAAGETWIVTADANGSLTARSGSRTVGPVAGLLTIRPRGDAALSLGGKPYRGAAVVRGSGNGRVTAINTVGLEDYLLGVVPHEIGKRPSAEVEVVKAQAVAARTYAIGALGSRAAQGFDMYATVMDQVYGGRAEEDTVATRAVRETAGQILAYEGKPIVAYYHSTCGPRTAAIEHSWPWRESKPYFRSVSDLVPGTDSTYYNQSSNRFRWTHSWTGEQLERILSRSLQAHTKAAAPVQTNPLTEVKILSKNVSGRVDSLAIVAGGNRYVVRADSLRWVLRADSARILNSSLLHEIRPTKNAAGRITNLEVVGGGWGHGVGMCQWGAIGRARAGQDYRTILTTYYPGVDIVDLY